MKTIIYKSKFRHYKKYNIVKGKNQGNKKPNIVMRNNIIQSNCRKSFQVKLIKIKTKMI